MRWNKNKRKKINEFLCIYNIEYYNYDIYKEMDA